MRLSFWSAICALLAACATPQPPRLSADLLTEAITRRPVVLLGEVHDNAAQHSVRAEALRRLIARGARPAIAFEQFDRERQSDLDRARTEPLAPGVSRVDHLIVQGGGAKSWNWDLYRPYLQLAIDHDLPIVAANLSRSAAMRVAQQGFGAELSDELQAAYGLGQLPTAFLTVHERAIDSGHCGLMPPAMLAPLAHAQIARDLTLMLAMRPHFERGVILLAGNGHVRNDIGVPYFLSVVERGRTVTIGLLESTNDASGASQFDVAMLAPPQPREDQCIALRKRYSPATGSPSQ